ncbi:hypothetical protein BKA70DRAFT_781433 [Coprinopsis sp. MPI-PUGE-AT-0042]|nr:hypothetical protein BKA70DRAFT_781433 [Coprinopsis sp. MPI-PUGE-AT-0042]
MLLPLWPGETDISTDTTTPFPMPLIPVEERMYLLIYYSPYECQDEKSKKGSKKSSHGSSSSSRDSAKARKPTLLQRFHFCARMVTYRDIQGSGVRCPDVGLSVIGPLQEAYASMPQQKHVHTEFTVIGQSHSRDRGVELIPEGFEKLGLATRELDPDASLKSEDDSSSISKEEEDPYTIHVLTPIGRAVVEMAWLGAMALTSFG